MQFRMKKKYCDKHDSCIIEYSSLYCPICQNSNNKSLLDLDSRSKYDRQISTLEDEIDYLRIFESEVMYLKNIIEDLKEQINNLKSKGLNQ